MNNSKEVLVKTIKEWISVDNEMKQIQKHMKLLRDKKKILSFIDLWLLKSDCCFIISLLLFKY